MKPTSLYRSLPFLIGAVLFFGILLRILFIFNPGFEADVSFWKAWGLAQADGGALWASRNSNSNYPTPFYYPLGILVKVYSFFADPHNFNEFWSNTNHLFLFISKLPAILADFGVFAIILYVGKHAKKLGFPSISLQYYLLFGALYLLNPVSVIDGAWWGQVDSVGVCIFLFAFLLVLKKHPFLAGVIYMAAVMTKLQNMIYGPLFFLYIWSTLGYNGLIRSIFGAMVSFFGLNIEFLLAHEMKRVISSLIDNYDYFPFMSLNAFNLWWIVSKAQGMKVSDKTLVLGLLSAKTTGLYIFISGYLFACLHNISEIIQTFKKNQSYVLYTDEIASPTHVAKTKHFIESLIIVAGTFFLFQADSHDRYAFPSLVFLLLWAPFLASSHMSRLKRSTVYQNLHLRVFLTLFFIFTLVYFYNLHTALVINYPNNGLPILSSLTGPFFTIGASILQIALFLIFSIYIARQVKPWVWISACIVLALLATKGNLPLLTRTPVSLTTIKPLVSQQGYLTTMINMPVNAASDFSKWSRLSDQYVFYKKGIGTHANSFINYDIGGLFQTFSTDYGIDTQAGDKGSAIFEIYGDGKKLFMSEKMGRYSYPKHTSVSVRGVHTLGLVVTDAGDGISDDHADWLNPQLFP